MESINALALAIEEFEHGVVIALLDFRECGVCFEAVHSSRPRPLLSSSSFAPSFHHSSCASDLISACTGFTSQVEEDLCQVDKIMLKGWA